LLARSSTSSNGRPKPKTIVDHYAKVDTLMRTGYESNPLTLDLEDDSNDDGRPDDLLQL
jgi:hypothetical protein